ncbi:Era-like GTP-binding protein [Methanotorris igneus]|uniref:Small GTP-binding protein n=1 Tax=Methanotorris igneus (strain DSM 5666 / JCM 11834 / Kol 5) TaxID=880724 RepID=F6BBX0_METIK|nr:Era-like GTP-binding protein [Methanotorris igneus]AEF97250.1 small GTP-binding protein [Methanotorris igneus Kol 5]
MENKIFKIAILGPENAGKSSIMNALFGKYVSLVSEVGGTTKMPVKRYWGKLKVGREKKQPKFVDVVFVDLGGLYVREKQSPIMVGSVLEQTYKEIDDADMIIHVIDGKEGLSKSFERLHHLLKFRYRKPIIVVINKCDLINGDERRQLKNYVEYRLNNRALLVSALTREGIDDLMEAILKYIKEGG